MTGLFDKYNITKTDGTLVDPEAVYFVLRLDPHARRVVGTYSFLCRDDNPELSADLLMMLQQLEHQRKEDTLARRRNTRTLRRSPRRG